MALGVMAFRYQPKQAIGIGPEMQIEDKDKTGEMAMRLRDVRVYTILDSVE